jgi:dihydroorotate dehydrogenase (NAD+) catalytic subunit
VYACASAVDLPIVGMGGVVSGRDALDLVAAGASAVALGTVLFADPTAAGRVRDEVASDIRSRGYRSAAGIRGIAHGSALLPAASSEQTT